MSLIDSERPLWSPPADRAQWPAWRDELAARRRDYQQRFGQQENCYTRPDLVWTQAAFVGAFAMLWDTRLYDRRRNRWILDAFLADGEKRFGGYDFIVFWHAYPLIGLDQRNQFDFYRDMPGGIEGLRTLSRALHKRGIKVFLDYNPWDTHTRREPLRDEEAMARMAADIEVDGIFLDTMANGPADMRACIDALRKGVAFESEVPVPPEHIGSHPISWIEHWGETLSVNPPGVLRNKWLEQRHMHHRVARFNRDHSEELHSSWMNGCGILVWENVFGSEMRWCPRDQSLLRSMRGIQRRYSALFATGAWTPLSDEPAPAVFASRWEGDGLSLWTLVNRGDSPSDMFVPMVGPDVHRSESSIPAGRPEAIHYFNLIEGVEGEIEYTPKGGAVRLSLRPRGIGCVLALPASKVDADFLAFLEQQKAVDAVAVWDTQSPRSPERLRKVRRTVVAASAEIPADMVTLPGGRFTMAASWRSRECGFYRNPALLADMPGGFHQMNFARRVAKVKPFAIDATPVTNAQYAGFLKASAYKPACMVNFLKHWVDGAPVAGQEEHPVVYVDLDDARAYAAWAGKRLPTEEEWQFAAGGAEGRCWPWQPKVAEDDPRWWPEAAGQARGDPHGDHVNRTTGTEPVKAHPAGRSPEGCWDLIGNVWEWTESEREDGASRFVQVKGGSYYRLENLCGWYTDGGPRQTHFSLKLLLVWPGLDRKGTVGFRCVKDMQKPGK